ncbi:MAG: class I SAM-dependent methyltransferase [Flavobacteriales bacterium]|nr:MAG: class I SAM-dependent methyltransferase [Flavobacteriales bacterium]
MGFNHTGTKLLIHAKAKGLSFGRTVMIGRQGLHLSAEVLQRNLDDFGLGHLNAEEIITGEKGYAEPFLKALGATAVDSLDASPYEQASIIHDMNLPMDGEHKGAFDTVIDGGSLEHIFNFPVAIRNCMELLKVGGHYLGITPANNFFGHGFYQFSPELYYRVFSKENGFEMTRLLFFIDRPGADWYEVKDADEVRERVTLVNGHPSYLFVMARRTAAKQIFAVAPQQSDYQNMLWKDGHATIGPDSRGLLVRVMDRLARLWPDAKVSGTKPIGVSNAQHFRKVTFK